MKIYKYTIPKNVPGIYSIAMQPGARIIAAGVEEDNTIVVWALVSNNDDPVSHRVRLMFTGETVSDNYIIGDHIDTLRIGWLVYHIFDMGERRNVPV